MAAPLSSASDSLPAPAVRRLYDRLAPWYDWLTFYEGRAIKRALDLLAPQPGEVVVNVGAGTGRDQHRLARAVAPAGLSFAVDASFEMLLVARQGGGGPWCQADAGNLPLRNSSADRLFSSYILDLLSPAARVRVLHEFHRVLKPAGRLALVSLTEGVTPFSQAVVRLWEALYAVTPIICGGCRPVRLSQAVLEAGLRVVHRETLVDFGVPSEIVLAEA